jgi:uncharacterized protein (DUF885 family)
MRRKRWVLACALSVACSACSSTSQSATTTPPAPVATEMIATASPSPAAEPAPTDFRSVADEITRSLLALEPELVTELGAGALIGLDGNYQLDDVSPKGWSAMVAAAEQGLVRLAAFDPDELTQQELISAAILRWHLQDVIEMGTYRDYENPVNFIAGAHAGFVEYMADVHPIVTEQDAEDYVERLIAFARQVEDLIDWLEESAARGITPTDGSLNIARFQIGVAIGSGDAASHPLVADLRSRVEALDGERRSWAVSIGARAEAAVTGLVIPALERLDDAVRRIDGRSDQLPGVSGVPGGDAYYAAVLRHHLSIDMAPDDVHEAGREQVERLVAELSAELAAFGYDAEADFAGAMRRVVADAGTLPTRSEPERAIVLEETVAIVEEASRVLSDLFSVKPEAALDVVRPRPGREGGSGAYYRSPPLDQSRSGVYYLSLGGSEFDVITMDTTTYHEAIPGHHFQLSVQRSLDGLPLHQRAFDHTGYAEGWALYAERLAHEAGLYSDNPLGNIGRLRMELLRAVRMVVDTGIHWAGWSRSEAIEYMTALGFDEPMAASEVDRYVVWPGQAPAYMVGMLEILRLRDRAEAELGEDFDLVGFHDALLSQGSVPLALLESVIDAWIAAVG